MKAKKPAWLVHYTDTYVDAVLRRQKHTVAALVEAGMTEYGIRFDCGLVVGHTQEMPERIDPQKVLAKRALAALSALNTVRGLVEQLYAADAALIQRMDQEQVTNALDQIEREAHRVKRPPEDTGPCRKQARMSSPNDGKPWRLLQVGLLAFFVERDTGSPNEALVANLCNELFAGCCPAGADN